MRDRGSEHEYGVRFTASSWNHGCLGLLEHDHFASGHVFARIQSTLSDGEPAYCVAWRRLIAPGFTRLESYQQIV